MSIFQDKRLNNGNNQNIVIHTLLNKKIDRHKTVTYKDFIKSKDWEVIKKAWYKKYGKDCKKCNSHNMIHLHHIVYPDLKGGYGKYLQVQDRHFISLCASCHKEYHKIYGVHQDMIKTSIRFIGKAKHNKIFSNRYKLSKINRKKKKRIKHKEFSYEIASKRKGLSVEQLLSI